jgi:hypothetical protein
MPPRTFKDTPPSLSPDPLDSTALAAGEATAIQELVAAYAAKWDRSPFPPAEMIAADFAAMTQLGETAIPVKLGRVEQAARALAIGASEIRVYRVLPGGGVQVELTSGVTYSLSPARLAG